MSKVQYKAKATEEAIDSQTKALRTFEVLEKFAGTDYLANIATVLSDW